jgi:hypothetical protein
MNLASTSMPGYRSPERVPYLRVGVAVGSDAIDTDTSSTHVGNRFVKFLSEGAALVLPSMMGNPREGCTWERRSGNGLVFLEAVLVQPGRETPIAGALFLPPTSA